MSRMSLNHNSDSACKFMVSIRQNLSRCSHKNLQQLGVLNMIIIIFNYYPTIMFINDYLTIISNYLLFILSLNSWLVKTSMSYLKKSSPGILGPPLSVRILSRYQSMAKTLGLERTVFLGPKGYLATQTKKCHLCHDFSS